MCSRYLRCRLCFNEEKELELIFDIEKLLIKTINDHLFEVKKKKSKYQQHFFFLFLFLQIKNIPGWPIGICDNCKCKLISATEFFSVCKNTQKILMEQLKNPNDPNNPPPEPNFFNAIQLIQPSSGKSS